MNLDGLNKIARAMVAPGKGILAADESHPTIRKRFEPIGVENTGENRRSYREMLFTAPGIEQWIGGVILFDETLRQKDASGVPFPELLAGRGIVPGIKVDAGARPLAGFPGEMVTEGLDGLRPRLEEYRGLGAAFAKWRAVIHIGDGIPTPFCIEANAHALARYAALCQEADLVPIVEPEVLMDGDHDIDQCFDATEATLREVFYQLAQQGVDLEGMVLKPNMVVSGSEASDRAGPETVAEMTLTCFLQTVPAAVPGIAFLSGGQSDEEATLNLDAINRLAGDVGAPWRLTFSFGRALQSAPQQAWRGQPANVERAQQAFLERARTTAEASSGAYQP
ncbi:MAG TPA: class I fructose-bisphosphate aldolase [Woeseiaceae bacterium]|nr:class I fructose-bisphosphate aldolase [Woeseiaceae bacterium]